MNTVTLQQVDDAWALLPDQTVTARAGGLTDTFLEGFSLLYLVLIYCDSHIDANMKVT